MPDSLSVGEETLEKFGCIQNSMARSSKMRISEYDWEILAFRQQDGTDWILITWVFQNPFYPEHEQPWGICEVVLGKYAFGTNSEKERLLNLKSSPVEQELENQLSEFRTLGI